MKLARERQLLEYFRWLAETLVEQVPDSLLKRLMLCALHADSELDARQIYRSLAANPGLKKRAMSVAEKLKTEGRWIGKIQALEEFPGRDQSTDEALETRSIQELESLHQDLHKEYEARFKRR